MQKKIVSKIVKPTINQIAKYIPGESLINGKSDVIKLSSNESPFKVPTKVSSIFENKLLTFLYVTDISKKDELKTIFVEHEIQEMEVGEDEKGFPILNIDLCGVEWVVHCCNEIYKYSHEFLYR